MELEKYLSLAHGIEDIIDEENIEYSFIFKLYNELKSNVGDAFKLSKLLLTTTNIHESICINFKTQSYILVTIPNVNELLLYASIMFPYDGNSYISKLENEKNSSIDKSNLIDDNTVYKCNLENLEKMLLSFIIIHELTHYIIESDKSFYKKINSKIEGTISITNYNSNLQPILVDYYELLANNKTSITDEVACDYYALNIIWACFVLGWCEWIPRDYSLNALATIKSLSLFSSLHNERHSDKFFKIRETIIQININDNMENFYATCLFYDYSEAVGDTMSHQVLEYYSNKADVLSKKILIPYFNFFNSYTDIIFDIVNSTLKESYFDIYDIKNLLRGSDFIISNLVRIEEIVENELIIDQIYNSSPLASLISNNYYNPSTDNLDNLLKRAMEDYQVFRKFTLIFRDQYIWNHI